MAPALRLAATLVAAAFGWLPAGAASKAPESPDPSYVLRDDRPLYTYFFDLGLPHFESTFDGRSFGPAGTEDNLAPRAVILALQEHAYVAFDTELLRVAAIWQGLPPDPKGMAMISYHAPLQKNRTGLRDLPTPRGQRIAATGLYPGWQPAGPLSLEDPRELWIDETELGRGPLDPDFAQWLGVEDAGSASLLHYRVGQARIRERFQARDIDGQLVVSRWVHYEGLSEPLQLVALDRGSSDPESPAPGSRLQTFTIRPSPEPALIRIDYSLEGARLAPVSANAPPTPSKTAPRWPQTIESSFQLGEPQGAFAVDELAIPYPNPWRRRIRPVDIEFHENGDALLLAFDGDVYRLQGLHKLKGPVTWKRIAGGFHDPQSIVLRGEEIFVFSRGGITQLLDRDGDGETDFYRMFCNRFTQSAETRDMALSMVLAPDGGFYISKGGQQHSALTPHSGRILKVSPDGQRVSVVAHGFRNGYLGFDPRSGLLTASDQQGNWVPSTPFFVIRQDAFYGFDLAQPPQAQAPVPPVLWLPHRVAQSGIGQIYGFDNRSAPLQDSLLYLNYQKPSAIAISLPKPGAVQTSASPLPVEFEIPLLKGDINPRDGFAYLVGFQIWDSAAPRLEGLSRLRVIGPHDGLADEAQIYSAGILLRYDEPLDPQAAIDVNNYRVAAWNYERTPRYGSPQYALDGEPGKTEWLVHTPLLSRDGQSVFLAIDGVQPAMQIEVQAKVLGSWQPTYLTANRLSEPDMASLGFEPVDFKALFQSTPSPRQTATDGSAPTVSAERGRQLHTQMGCVGCHSIDGSSEGRSGPTWLSLYGSIRHLSDGSTAIADETYLRQAILAPEAQVVADYQNDAGMPSYLGILKEDEIASLIAFIRSLR